MGPNFLTSKYVIKSFPSPKHAVHGVDLVDLRRHTIEEEQMAGCGVELRVLGVRAAVRTRVDKGHDVVGGPEATIRPGLTTQMRFFPSSEMNSVLVPGS